MVDIPEPHAGYSHHLDLRARIIAAICRPSGPGAAEEATRVLRQLGGGKAGELIDRK